ncbi:MAG: tRNA uridine 5-carboxymethylaminomethyl modification enzyme GidA [Bacteroidetes bacterium HLUCCA01]|nr:MAG: tRNA uridine 5-carboxymethylaminomethyl modification enzyme GidA [Bacteroidetes bacterium HLUCCA01]
MESLYPEFDVIVVGGGHAGSEAAGAAAQMGSKTLLISMNLNSIAQMSCNPAMGGVAKGQLVREIDALGGLSGLVTDSSGVQFRMLNLSKGPAMWSPRAQSDRMLYATHMREQLEKKEHLYFRQDNVVTILINDSKEAYGVVTQTGQTILSKTVIVTSGTFLNGLIHIGEKNYGGGRSGERASKGITECLVDEGFEFGRLKTGTPPRLDGRSVNYDKLEIQYGDEKPVPFSFMNDTVLEGKEQLTCWIGYTNQDVHDMLKTGFDRSPMFNGSIKSTGPRYCPSIEDKINRFADRDRHQLFLEPEGWNTYEMYLNGFSTSLPEDVQYKALRTIPGFEEAVMLRPGYAIEYDFFPPHQIYRSMETKIIANLFFAGQINGTTGYEEAACQGLMAGINASLKVKGDEPLILKRSDAYIGVLIDDLVGKGTDEPYRMFTSRAEHRIVLRQDNADLRLTEIGRTIGLVDDDRYNRFLTKKEHVDALHSLVSDYSVRADKLNSYLESVGTSPLKQTVKLISVVTRPQVSLEGIIESDNDLKESVSAITSDPKVIEQVEIQLKYAGYIEKENEMVLEMNRQENMVIPKKINYGSIKSLSAEGVSKLEKVRPETIGQASRISGVTPSDVAVLMVYLKN